MGTMAPSQFSIASLHVAAFCKPEVDVPQPNGLEHFRCHQRIVKASIPLISSIGEMPAFMFRPNRK